MRQRSNRYAPTAVFHVAGLENVLADVASRPVAGIAEHFHLFEKDPHAMCPITFLTHFNTSYPLTQKQHWLNAQPPSALWSNVISTLRGRQLELRRWTMTCEELGGITGPRMHASVESIPGSESSQKSRNNRTSLPLPPGFKLAYSGVQFKLDTRVWKCPPSRGANPRHGWIRRPKTQPRDKRDKFAFSAPACKLQDSGSGAKASGSASCQYN